MSFHGSLSSGGVVCIASHPKCKIKIHSMSVSPSGVVHLHLENGVLCSYKYSKSSGWVIVVQGKRVPKSDWRNQRYALLELPVEGK